MKYYIYISDAKINMLLPQITHETKRKTATELKIDFKVFSASRKTDHGDIDNRIDKLEAVSKFIFEYGDVGTADEPSEYVADTLSMRWGFIEDKKLVYFSGSTENTVIGLGGSGKHVLGNTSTSSIDAFNAGSYLSVLIYSLSQQFKLDSEDEAKLLRLRERLDDMEMHFYSRPMSESIIELRTLEVVYRAFEGMRGPQQRLEFLAKRLFYNDAYGKKVLLATPIYIAMAD